MFQKLECRIYFKKANNFRLDTIFKKLFHLYKINHPFLELFSYVHKYTLK
ncbi:hypothetical protein LEP1GSC034_1278 [Leptospira interrogans str. 2003000735]|uniref:Uncharacterized protein n=3 Tax=Leptospira interrogans TaxID=173 RepID=A0A829D8W2_LEPIR|nr:hypothetical protein G436_1086 [Leptospira interrogans serovar Hardjo str. Norma]EKN89100.1 hypothetical protein LEP1GSC027_4618 [Leptospira interrogans str. 2002000624]EKO96842.1 hypothetical protein LEP1GSC057_3696 [Leptospira interrogans str. Brem 329]EKQ38284.1 hypothetical protein LEP1GSC025_4562 [Leptospira interrogans str. 2002000621]EMJ69696.1 hypothetical protein LEP1GSC033_1629 [Leptospira interrogans str. 2002000632]EMJ73725.1 hypothetical protein LEP1GSC034_1278 [Leptospira inte